MPDGPRLRYSVAGHTRRTRARAVAWCAVAAGVAAAGPSPAEEPARPAVAATGGTAPIRVMSFNIRYGTADDGPNRWDRRRDLLVGTIRAFDPDLLGTQETLAGQKAELDDRLPGYRSVGVGRDDGKRRGEMTAVWYRDERFELLDRGHAWLSEEPDRPGSVSWDAALTRMATWVKLRERGRAEAPPIVFLNTHFDHRGAEARRRSAVLLRTLIARIGAGCDVILTGDFNADEGSPPHVELFGDPAIGPRGGPPPFHDAHRVAHPDRTEEEGTFNGFDPGRIAGPRIDWIGVSAGWTVRAAGIDRTSRKGSCPSDHFPVTAVLDR